MRLSKIEWNDPWFEVTLSAEGEETQVIFTGNFERALDLANEWENA